MIENQLFDIEKSNFVEHKIDVLIEKIDFSINTNANKQLKKTKKNKKHLLDNYVKANFVYKSL